MQNKSIERDPGDSKKKNGQGYFYQEMVNSGEVKVP